MSKRISTDGGPPHAQAQAQAREDELRAGTVIMTASLLSTLSRSWAAFKALLSWMPCEDVHPTSLTRPVSANAALVGAGRGGEAGRGRSRHRMHQPATEAGAHGAGGHWSPVEHGSEASCWRAREQGRLCTSSRTRSARGSSL